jgi:DNA-binding CsgD family transcriptional regulator
MLHISEGTVKNHLKIVFRKLNIDRRSSLRGRLR